MWENMFYQAVWERRAGASDVLVDGGVVFSWYRRPTWLLRDA